ncbi:B3/4 domain-containing protein [Aestuariivirga sp.]|uniref:B3/B4 domain-containing protein n=1 Tax=Aestuariivirga sp. TaxID=2650926 RepID=UPI00391DC694
MEFRPHIAPEIFALRPDFMALSIFVEGVTNTASTDFSGALLAQACGDLASAPWHDAHLAAWRDAYRTFGAKPQRTPCSAEALRKRCERDGRVPETNAVVDLYNAISIRYAIPVGGEDASAYVGQPQLVRATGDESFDTTADGQPKMETVDKGEVVWRDKRGVTCRRWNWRQGTRTRITEASTSLWFVLERLEPMPVEALLNAGKNLVEGLEAMGPAKGAGFVLLDADNPDGRLHF